MITRKFKCPFCGYVHVFSPKGKSRRKKRVVGFTCPGCGKKPTEEDFKKKKGRGPKLKEERRKRVKKVEETPLIVAPQPNVEQPKWRTSGPPPPRERQRYGTRRSGWQPKPRQPTDRTLGEALGVSIQEDTYDPISGLHSEDLEDLELEEEKLENKEYRKIDIEKLEKHEKKLALMIVRFDRVEERLDATVKKLDIRLTELDNKLQALSTLTSHMELILDAAERKMPRTKSYNRR